MNLNGLQQFVRMHFGTCESKCGKCDSCQVSTLVEMAWTSGQRSGAQSSSVRKKSETTWEGWDWSTAARTEIARYGNNLGLDASDVQYHWRQVELWAKSKGATKSDWMSFTKAWMEREAKKNPPVSAQMDLVGNAPSTRATERDMRRMGTVTSLVGRSPS